MARTKKVSPNSLSSRILDVVREEVKSQGRRRVTKTDYYAKTRNPKDGGYAKSNYVKGDGIRVTGDRDPGLTIRLRPSKKRLVKKAAKKRTAKKPVKKAAKKRTVKKPVKKAAKKAAKKRAAKKR